MLLFDIVCRFVLCMSLCVCVLVSGFFGARTRGTNQLEDVLGASLEEFPNIPPALAVGGAAHDHLEIVSQKLPSEKIAEDQGEVSLTEAPTSWHIMAHHSTPQYATSRHGTPRHAMAHHSTP